MNPMLYIISVDSTPSKDYSPSNLYLTDCFLYLNPSFNNVRLVNWSTIIVIIRFISTTNVLLDAATNRPATIDRLDVEAVNPQ